MASTSSKADHLLGLCLRGEPWTRADLEPVLDDPALFRVVAEGLGDRFEPALCDVYARLFAEAISLARPDFDAAALVDRYRRVRVPRPPSFEPERVVVLSRVTLGADIVVSSVLLDAALRRFPNARVALAGSRKAWELFAGHPRVEHIPVDYARGGLRQRLSHFEELRAELSGPGTMVLDPDSRLTQLGLLPVCPDERYFFFESRAAGGNSDAPLAQLAAEWAARVLEVADARPWMQPRREAEIDTRPSVAISLGVGENPAKRVADPFEAELLRRFSGWSIWIDKGAGGEEAARVDRAVAGLPRVRVWTGSFAGFASIVAQCSLYVGYDSAGQHAAAAAGAPLLSVFTGFPAPRLYDRWRPTGRGRIEVVRLERPDPSEALARVDAALARLKP